MAKCAILLVFYIAIALAGKLTKSPNGDYYVITGKGCGISTPLKYMALIPENPEAHECVIIQNYEYVAQNHGNECKDFIFFIYQKEELQWNQGNFPEFLLEITISHF